MNLKHLLSQFTGGGGKAADRALGQGAAFNILFALFIIAYYFFIQPLITSSSWNINGKTPAGPGEIALGCLLVLALALEPIGLLFFQQMVRASAHRTETEKKNFGGAMVVLVMGRVTLDAGFMLALLHYFHDANGWYAAPFCVVRLLVYTAIVLTMDRPYKKKITPLKGFLARLFIFLYSAIAFSLSWQIMVMGMFPRVDLFSRDDMLTLLLLAPLGYFLFLLPLRAGDIMEHFASVQGKYDKLINLASTVILILAAYLPMVKVYNAADYHDRGMNDGYDTKSAVYHFTRAISLDPGNPDSYFGRGRAYFWMGSNSNAIADLGRAVGMVPADTNYTSTLAKTYYWMGMADITNRYAAALENFDRALSLDPDNAEYLQERGALLAFMGSNSRALSDFSSAIEIDPSGGNNYFYRSRIFHSAGKTSMELADLDQAIQRYSKYRYFQGYNKEYELKEESFYDRAEILYRGGAVSNARADYEKSAGYGYQPAKDRLKERFGITFTGR